jgi:hypothetical protein
VGLGKRGRGQSGRLAERHLGRAEITLSQVSRVRRPGSFAAGDRTIGLGRRGHGTHNTETQALGILGGLLYTTSSFRHTLNSEADFEAADQRFSRLISQ